MKILLVGEMSNLHWTLAEALRLKGYNVVTVGDGNHWKGFKTDNLILRKYHGKLGGLLYLLSVIKVFTKFRGYDVVQFISPKFLELKPRWNNLLYIWLKKMNKKVYFGAFGDDKYWIEKCLNPNGFRYSNFVIDSKLWVCPKNSALEASWLYGPIAKLNEKMAHDSNGIVACLYEYYASYIDFFPLKTIFIPLPINTSILNPKKHQFDGIVRFFIGIQETRSEWKGTDVMYKALVRIEKDYPNDCVVTKAVSVPYHDYVEMLQNSDVILDQLYSYTPSMNSLIAMAQGLIVVGGGEEENYEIIEETDLRPIINVLPSEEDVYKKLEWIIQNKAEIPRLSVQSIRYVEKHHNYIDVAQKYLNFWATH